VLVQILKDEVADTRACANFKGWSHRHTCSCANSEGWSRRHTCLCKFWRMRSPTRACANSEGWSHRPHVLVQILNDEVTDTHVLVQILKDEVTDTHVLVQILKDAFTDTCVCAISDGSNDCHVLKWPTEANRQPLNRPQSTDEVSLSWGTNTVSYRGQILLPLTPPVRRFLSTMNGRQLL
jgi:hypothetical protein